MSDDAALPPAHINDERPALQSAASSIARSLRSRLILLSSCAALGGIVVFTLVKISEHQEPSIWGIARIGGGSCSVLMERAQAAPVLTRPDGAMIAYARVPIEDGRHLQERWIMCIDGRVVSYRFSAPSGRVNPLLLERAYSSRGQRISGKPLSEECGETRFSAGHVVLILDARPNCERYQVTYETHKRISTGAHPW